MSLTLRRRTLSSLTSLSSEYQLIRRLSETLDLKLNSLTRIARRRCKEYCVEKEESQSTRGKGKGERGKQESDQEPKPKTN